MELLLLLVERSGALVTREEIINRIWGKDVFLDTDASINAAIRKIRQVLKDDPERPRFVQTVTGRGYRFIATLEETGPVPLPPVPAPAVATDNLAGKKVSHYRVVKLLGGGGMGVVYQAEDIKLGRRVALKFLPAELSSDPNAFQRLQAEARAASSLDHPNICSIYELGEHDGQPFIAMQLLDGQTLREWIEARAGLNAPLPIDEVLDLAIQIASGLEAAHQKGIVHRDIKPANIFITNHNQAKILDFGVAKWIHTAEAHSDGSTTDHPNPSITRTGASMGTPSYLSPEQVRGEQLDARADLFALGLVLYEMATGKQAFPGNTISVIREAVLHQPATPIRQIDPSLCQQLEAIIAHALEKDRDKRYQSAADLREDAERLKTKLRVDANKPSHTRLWIMSTAATLAIIIATGYWVGMRPRLKAQPSVELPAPIKARPSVAVLGFKNLSGRGDFAWMSTALSEMLNTDLANGQHLRVIPSESVSHMTADLALPADDSYSSSTLKKIRNHLGTDMVVVGSYLASDAAQGTKIRIDLHLQDARTGEMIAAVSTDGTASDLGDLASRGSANLRQALGLPASTDTNALELRTSIPSNPEAARFYAEGLERYRNFDNLAARHSFEQAIAADPAHALSHSALAECLSVLGYDNLAQAEAKKGLDLARDVSREEHLLVEGRYRELTHDMPGAIEIYRTLYNFFPDDLGYALRLAAAQTKAGQGKDALQTVERTRKLPEPEGTDAQIDLAAGSAAVAVGDYDYGLRASMASANRALAQGNRMVAATALLHASWTYIRHHDTDNALAVLTQAQKVASGGVDVRTTAKITHGIALVEQQRGNIEASRASYEKALSDFRRIGSVWDIASTSHNYGVLLYEHGDMLASRKLLENALQIQRTIHDDRGTAADLDDLSNVLVSTGELNLVGPMKEEALKLFRGAGDRKGEAITLYAYGNALLLQGNLADARQKCEQSVKLMRDLGEVTSLADALATLSDVAFAQDRLSEAEDYAQQALAIRQRAKANSATAQSKVQLAEIALAQGHAAEAESLANGAVNLLEENPLSGAYAYSVLSRARRAQGKVKEAQTASEHATALSHQTGDLPSRFEAALAMTGGSGGEATKSLNSVRQEASRGGYDTFELEARIRLAQLDSNATLKSARLNQLQSEAKQKGYLLLAREASSPSH